MIKVDQTTFGPTQGNCFSACIASILELPIERVPFFMAPESTDGKHWWVRFCAWAEENHVKVVYHGGPEPTAPAGFSIWSGRSPRTDGYHAVVALDGVMIHDPHVGDRRGVTSVLDYITVEWECAAST